jgi:hypothetical protein
MRILPGDVAHGRSSSNRREACLSYGEGPHRAALSSREDTTKALLVTLAALLALLAAPGAAAREYYIAPFELLEVYGTYPLSDGSVLRVGPANAGTRAWAQVNGTERMRLVAVGALEFVTRDGRLKLRFEPLPFTTEVRVARVSGSQGELGKLE